MKVRLDLDEYFPSAGSDTMGLTLKIFPSFNPFEMVEVKIPPGYQALIALEKEVTVLANSPLRTVCNSSADKDKSEFWCGGECMMKKLVDIYGCAPYLLDLSAFGGTFFRVCSHKEAQAVFMRGQHIQVSSSFVAHSIQECP